jgi:hypothetical protein
MLAAQMGHAMERVVKQRAQQAANGTRQNSEYRPLAKGLYVSLRIVDLIQPGHNIPLSSCFPHFSTFFARWQFLNLDLSHPDGKGVPGIPQQGRKQQFIVSFYRKILVFLLTKPAHSHIMK